MNIDRKALWAVRQSALPTVVRPCPDCVGTRHRPSGRFRVNANGKLLDVWLLLHCAGCGRTSKVPVHERAHVSSLEPARREAYEANSPAAVRELAMSASLAAKNGYRLDWTGTWELKTDTPCSALDDPRPLDVQVGFELPAPVRVERLLMLGLGLSRTAVRGMVADGRIHLPFAPRARTHQDFAFTVDGSGRADPPAAPGHLEQAGRRRGAFAGTGTRTAASSPAERAVADALAVTGLLGAGVHRPLVPAQALLPPVPMRRPTKSTVAAPNSTRPGPAVPAAGAAAPGFGELSRTTGD